MSDADRTLLIEAPLFFVDLAIVLALPYDALPPAALVLAVLLNLALLLLAGRLLHVILHGWPQ